MSTTINDKISVFTKVLVERIENRYQERRSKIIEHYETERQKIIGQYEKNIKESVFKAEKDAKIKRQQMVSRARTAQYLELLKKRRYFADVIMEDIRAHAKEFVETNDYKPFLKKTIIEVAEHFSNGQFIVFGFTKSDLENHGTFILDCLKSVKKPEDFKIEMASEEMIGGVFAISIDGKMEIDYSINTIIQESRSSVGQLLSQICEGGKN